MIFLIAANIILASTFTISKALLAYLSPFCIIAVRFIGASALSLSGFAFLQSEKRFQGFSGTSVLLLIKLIGSSVATYFFEIWALQYVTSIKVTLIYNACTFIFVFYSYIYFAEQMNTKKWIGFAIGMSSIIPLLLSQAQSTEEALTLFWRISWPEVALIAAMISNGYSWVCTRILVRDYQYPVSLINGINSLILGLMMGCIAILAEPLRIKGNLYSVIALLVLLCVAEVASNNGITYWFKRYSLTLISYVGLTLPFFTAILGYIFLGEYMTYDAFISIAITAVGLYIFYQEELKLGYII
jgi:drug/metabolite transporter (DMT)-like permease